MKTGELFDVAGLSVVITGGAGGLGRAIADAMVDNGASVTLIDRDAAALDAAVSQLSASGGTVSGITADVSDRAGLVQAIEEAAQRHGRLDVVFANAGIDAGPGFLSMAGERDPAGAIENVPDALWNRVIETNLSSMFTTIRAAVPYMKRQRSGRIILTSSIAGVRPGAIVGMPYQISKAGVAHLAKQSRAGARALQYPGQRDPPGAFPHTADDARTRETLLGRQPPAPGR